MATPEQISQYQQKWQNAVDTVFADIDAEGWKKEKTHKGVDIYLRHDKSSSFAQVKSIVTIDAPIGKVEENLKTVKPVDHSTPKHEGEGNLERRLIPAGDGTDCMGFFYVVVESPSSLVSPREFLTFQRMIHKDNKIALVRTSIENDEIQKPQKGYVRGNMFFQAFVVEPEGDKSKLTFIVHADPCGKVPSAIYNSAATGQGMSALHIKEEVEGQK